MILAMKNELTIFYDAYCRHQEKNRQIHGFCKANKKKKKRKKGQ